MSLRVVKESLVRFAIDRRGGWYDVSAPFEKLLTFRSRSLALCQKSMRLENGTVVPPLSLVFIEEALSIKTSRVASKCEVVCI